MITSETYNALYEFLCHYNKKTKINLKNWCAFGLVQPKGRREGEPLRFITF